MEDTQTRDMNRIRLRLIDLTKSFFVDEPDAERLSRWRGIFAALGREQINTGLDQAVEKIGILLDAKKLNEIQDEYYEVFGNPFDDQVVSLSASFYADGRSYGQTLADFRGFIQQTDLIKNSQVIDAEDSLPVMLDFLASMIEVKTREDVDTDKYQGVLVNDYLAPLASAFNKSLKNHQAADFYAACGDFLQGYVELEKGLFEPV